MDAVAEIKARLPIDQLVGRYVQLTKKGRNLVGLCPFHNDSHPSFLVSPDKGICYCFPCQKGGDIFSFYQSIEGVEFREALKDLAGMAGVELPDAPVETVKKDEKERIRDCLTTAASFYARTLRASSVVLEYLAKRGVSEAEREEYGLGLAPDGYTATYETLLKGGFSRKEILAAGLGIQKDLKEERMYDRFRNRLMFPIEDGQGRIIGFGGRTMAGEDAKYLNVSDGPLYRKSTVLYGLHRALPSMRSTRSAVLVEGYFDVLACHRIGVREAVATCGTALTDEHVRLLKRTVQSVVLCMDSDRAGRDAAERAFQLLSREGMQVYGVFLPEKDPADMALTDPEELKRLLTDGRRPFLSIVGDEIREGDLKDPAVRQQAIDRLMPLLAAIPSGTQRTHAIREAAAALSTTETSLLEDVGRFEKHGRVVTTASTGTAKATAPFSPAELTLALFLLYPRNIHLLEEMLPPEDPFASAMFAALSQEKDAKKPVLESIAVSDEYRQKAAVLLLYCEEHGLAQWNESMATREIRRNCRIANRDVIQRRQKEITQQLLQAQKEGKRDQEAELTERYKKLLEMTRLVREPE